LDSAFYGLISARQSLMSSESRRRTPNANAER
jgi:hypothetical protein